MAWLITIRKFNYLNTHMLMNAYMCVLHPVAEQSFIFSEGNPAQALIVLQILTGCICVLIVQLFWLFMLSYL